MSVHDTFTQYVMPTYGRFPLVPEKAEGSWLWDDQGKKYLDFCTGIAVCSIGHCHPRLVAAIQEQAGKLMHCSNLYEIPQQAELAKTIVEEFVKIPGKVFFSNSGAEANEGLIKLARKFGNAKPTTDGTPRHEVITFRNSFHLMSARVTCLILCFAPVVVAETNREPLFFILKFGRKENSMASCQVIAHVEKFTRTFCCFNFKLKYNYFHLSEWVKGCSNTNHFRVRGKKMKIEGNFFKNIS